MGQLKDGVAFDMSIIFHYLVFFFLDIWHVLSLQVNTHFTKFGVFTVVSTKIIVLLSVMPCSLVYRYEYFCGICCFHLRSRTFLQNVQTYLKNCTASHLRAG